MIPTAHAHRVLVCVFTLVFRVYQHWGLVASFIFSNNFRSNFVTYMNWRVSWRLTKKGWMNASLDMGGLRRGISGKEERERKVVESGSLSVSAWRTCVLVGARAMEHVFYLGENTAGRRRDSRSAPSGSSSHGGRPGSRAGDTLYLPTLGAEIIVGENARIEVKETSSRSRRVWRDRTRFDDRMKERKRVNTIAKGEDSIIDLDGFDPEYGDGPNPLSMPSTPKDRVYVRPLDTESGLAAYFSMQGDWTSAGLPATSPLSKKVSPRSRPRPNTVGFKPDASSASTAGVDGEDSVLGPRSSVSHEESLASVNSKQTLRSPFVNAAPRPSTTNDVLVSREYLTTPTRGRVKKDFQDFSRASRTAPLDRLRHKRRRQLKSRASTRGSSARPGTADAAAEAFVRFQMTLSAKPKRKTAEVKGMCAMCSMRRSKFSDFCDRCALKLRVSRADIVKASRKSWVRSGRAATFMLELAEDDIAVTRLSFKEAKEAYRVVRDTRNTNKESAGYETWEEALAHSNEAHHAAIKVQAIFRGFRFRARFRAGRTSLVRLQSWFRGAKARVYVAWHRHRWYTSIAIQKIIRGFLTFRKVDVQLKRESALIIQCFYRCIMAWRLLQYKKAMKLKAMRAESALVIQCAWRRKGAYVVVGKMFKKKRGAIAMQKTWRMFACREEFLYQKDCAVELQRHLRRWLAENEIARRRARVKAEQKRIRQIHDAAATRIQQMCRVWLAIRLADRKKLMMDSAQEALDTAEDRYNEVSSKGEWPSSAHYVEYALMLMYDAMEWAEAAKMLRHGLGREPKDGQLLFTYAILCQLRRNKANNDLEEADRRKKEALAADITRKCARRLEILYRVLIKMFPTSTLVLASYAVFHQFIRDQNTSALYFQKAIKIDPYNNKVIGAFGQFEEEANRSRAIIRGEKTSAWFSEEDFRFEDMALMTDIDLKHPQSKKVVRLQVRCYFLGENIMIKAKEVPKKVSSLMVELGRAVRPTEDERKAMEDNAEEYRTFLTDKDVNIFVKVLDMKYLLLPTNRKPLLHKIVARLCFQELVVTQKLALAIEFRQEAWIHCTHITRDKWFLSVMATCKDRVAERLAKTEHLQATKAFEGSDMDTDDEEGGGKRFARRGGRSRNSQGKKKPATKKVFASPGKSSGKKKRSPFDVVAVPDEMKDSRADKEYFEGPDVDEKGRKIPHEERLAKGRSIVFVAYIEKIKKSYRLTVTGEQIIKLFVDQPMLVKKFLRPGWRLQAQPLVLRLVEMLELVATNETPRVYEKKMVLVDGKYVSKTFDVTPDHEPTRKLLLSRLEERMEEARLNIAATTIQKVCRGHLGRKYVKDYLPWSSAVNIQRVWRGLLGRRYFQKVLYHESRRKASTRIQSLVRRYFKRIELSAQLNAKFPFSSGDWKKVWVAFTFQRANAEISDRAKVADVTKVKAALWYQTMASPINDELSMKFYRAIQGTQEHSSADFNFGYGIYLIRNQGGMTEARKHIERGFRLDPGGRAFQVTENSFFYRAAAVRSDEIEAQLNYGLILSYIRNDPARAETYLDVVERLCDAEMLSVENLDLMRSADIAAPGKDPVQQRKEEKRAEWRETVLQVVGMARERLGKFHKMVIPFQAMVRGHFARSEHGPAVLFKLSQYEYKLMPDNGRVVARIGLAYHSVKLDYARAVELYRLSLNIDDHDASTHYAYGLALASLAAVEADPEKFRLSEEAIKTGRNLDKANRSYQWFEQEYFLPTDHDRWKPNRQYGQVDFQKESIKDVAHLAQIAAKKNDGDKLDSVEKEMSAKILCNRALIAQWLREDYGEANKLFIEALLLSPADKMVIGCYQYFFDQGLSTHIPNSEILFANHLRARLENTRETRAERDARLLRLEQERIVRVKKQGLLRDRARRDEAMDRVKEAHEREKMFSEDHALRGKLNSLARQREGIVKSIGKSATELAEERKRKREESRKNKKAAQVAAAKAKKKGKNKKAEKKPKVGREKEHGQNATPMSKAKTFTLSE